MIKRNLPSLFSGILFGIPWFGFQLPPSAMAQAPESPSGAWKATVLPIELEVGYAVRAIDLSRDGKLDIAIVDSKRIVWLENPTWKVHTIFQTPANYADNVCFAPSDIDGDGDIDFGIGTDWQPNNTQSGGAVGWLESPADPRGMWTYRPILEPEPTAHRMHFADWDSDGSDELIVAPLKGPKSTGPKFEDVPVRLSAFIPGKNPRKDAWANRTIEVPLFVMHNFDVLKRSGKGADLITASFQGVHILSRDPQSGSVAIRRIGSGLEAQAPAKGSSEVRLGKLTSERRFAATIEPWHGNQVVVYEEPGSKDDAQGLWPRKVIDAELKWGHAVVTVNLDSDPEDELAIGVRDDAAPHRCGVRLYDRQGDGSWKRTLLEPGQVAVEDMVSADLDGDGNPELIAVGRATHNAVVYSRD